MFQQTLFIVLFIYLFVLIAIGRWTSRGESKEGFLIADRNVGFRQVLMSRAAGIIGIGSFITIGGFAYQYGWSVYSYLAGATVGYLLFAYRGVPRVLQGARIEKFYTLGDVVRSRLKDLRAKQLTEILTIILLVLIGLVQVVGGAKIISHFGGLGYETALLITGVIVGAYLIVGGFKAVLATDLIQLVIIVGLGALVGRMSRTNADAASGNVSLESLGPLLIVGFFLYGIFEPYANSMLYQLCYAAKDTKTAQKSIALARIPNAIIVTAVILMGIAVNAHHKGIDPDLTFLVGVENFLTPSLIGLAIIMLFSGLMSSLDTLVYSASSHFAFLMHDRDEDKLITYIRRYIVCILLLLIVIGFFWRNIIDISVLTAAIAAGLLPVAMINLLKGNNSVRQFFGSVLGGFIGLIIGIALLGIEPTIFITILLGAGIGVMLPKFIGRTRI